MSYTKTEWNRGDIITAAKLNNAENGIAANEASVTALKNDLTQEVDATYGLLDATYNTQYLFNSSAIHGSYYSRQNDAITTINNATHVRYPKISSLPSGTYSFIKIARGYSFVEYVSDGSLHTFTELGATTTKGTLVISETFNLYATGFEENYETSMFVDVDSTPETYIEGRYNIKFGALEQITDIKNGLNTTEIVNLDNRTLQKGYIKSDNSINYSANAHFCIVNISKISTVSITAGESTAYYGFLRSFTYGSPADFSTATGFTGRIYVSAGNTANYTKPEDANYLYIQMETNGTRIVPAKVVIDGYDIVESALLNITAAKKSISDLQTTNIELNAKYAELKNDLTQEVDVTYDLLDITYNTQYLFNSSAIHGSYYARQNDTIITIDHATYIRYPKISLLPSGTYSFIGLVRGYSIVEYLSDGSLHTFTELGATTSQGTLAIPEAFNLYATGVEETYETSMFVDTDSIPETYIEGRYNAKSGTLEQKMDVPDNTGVYGQTLMSNGDGTTSWVSQQDSASEDELTEIRNQIFDKNTMGSTLYSPNVTPVINHAYINVNGEEIAEPETSTWNVTDYIDVVSGAKITYKNYFLLGNPVYWAFYNAKYELVESFKPTNDGAEHSITVPESASFIRFSVRGSDVERFTASLSYRDYLSLDVPDYYFTNDYLPNKVSRIREVIKETEGNCDVFLFITDMHWLLNAQKSPALISYISKRVNIPRLIDGGDRANGINIECNVAMKKCFQGKEYFTVGNHEYINGLVDYDGNITKTFITDDGAMYAEYNAARDDVNTDNISRGYYYFDNPVQKIRYIILASFTYNDGTAAGGGYEDTQLTWFSDVVNNTAAGWHILVITHFLVTTTLASYRKRFTDVLTNYTGDAIIIGIVEGHTHFDQVFSSDDSSATIVDGVYTTSALPILSVTCDKNTPYSTDKCLDDRISGTIKEQAFDVIVINKKDKVLHQIRIGCPIRDGDDPSVWTEMQERKLAFYNSI